MRLEQLIYLLDLQETHSLTQTANKYFISHQALSQAIKALEKELSVTLLKRSSRGVEFTKSGNRVCEFSKIVQYEMQLMQNDLFTYQNTDSEIITGNLTIYTTARFATSAFFSFLQNFNTSYPQCKICFYTSSQENILNMDFDESTIAFFTKADDIPLDFLSQYNKSGYNLTILDTQNLFACVHKNSPLAKEKYLTLYDSSKYPFVAFNYSFSFSPKGIYRPLYLIDSFEQQRNLIKNKNCFGLYTKQEYNLFFQKNYILLPLENDIPLHFMALSNINHNQLVDFFIAHYRKRFCSHN